MKAEDIKEGTRFKKTDSSSKYEITKVNPELSEEAALGVALVAPGWVRFVILDDLDVNSRVAFKGQTIEYKLLLDDNYVLTK